MKKIIIALTAMVLAMVSCQKPEEFGLAELKADITTHAFENSKEANATVNIKATRDWTARVEPATEGVTINPASGKGSADYQTVTVAVAENKAKNRRFEVIFSAAECKDIKIKFTQPGEAGMAIADIADMNVDEAVSVEGTIVAVHQKGCIIEDETGRVLAFDTNSTKEFAKIGKTAKIQGKIYIHKNGIKQIVPDGTNTLYTETGDKAVKFPENATVVTKDNYGSIDWNSFEPVVIEGSISISGNYTNLNFGATDGSDASISYPLASLGFDKLNGANVKVEGYSVGIGGSSHYQIMATSVVKTGEAEATKTDIASIYDETKVAMGALVSVDATVVALHKRGFYIKDNTGIIYVFEGTNVTEHIAAVGNKITINAIKAENYGTIQLKNADIKANDNSTAKPDHGTPEVVTDVKGFDVTKGAKYIEVKGKMDENGYNLMVGANKVLFNYVIENYTHLANVDVTVRGYANSRSRGGDLQIVPVEVIAEPYLVTNDVEALATETAAEIIVKSNVEWNYTVDAAATWVKSHEKKGDKILFTFDANTEPKAKTANITITSSLGEKVVKLTQNGALPAGQTMASKTIAELTNNTESKTTPVTEMKLDDVVTLSVTGGQNTGKVYAGGAEWRLYGSEKAELTVACAAGYELVSVMVTFINSNDGCLTNGGTEFKSGDVHTVSGANVTYKVERATASTSTKYPQVKVTAVEVVYKKL